VSDVPFDRTRRLGHKGTAADAGAFDDPGRFGGPDPRHRRRPKNLVIKDRSRVMMPANVTQRFPGLKGKFPQFFHIK
jgi:hypothetical protein